jgi:hypothetical protein
VTLVENDPDANSNPDTLVENDPLSDTRFVILEENELDDVSIE